MRAGNTYNSTTYQLHYINTGSVQYCTVEFPYSRHPI